VAKIELPSLQPVRSDTFINGLTAELMRYRFHIELRSLNGYHRGVNHRAAEEAASNAIS
jgi:hypothetical protein